MTDPRWSDETRECVAVLLYEQAADDDQWDAQRELRREYYRDRADELLAVVADTGVLLPPGTETKVLWATMEDDVTCVFGSSAGAEKGAREDIVNGGVLMRRRLHVEPWEETE